MGVLRPKKQKVARIDAVGLRMEITKMATFKMRKNDRINDRKWALSYGGFDYKWKV